MTSAIVRSPAWPLAIVLACTIVLGGGGSPAPLLELGLQIITAVIAAWWIFSERTALSRVPASIWLVAMLIIGVHLIQLLPLPPGLWHALPGRADERAALALIGASDSWRPLSLSPARTLASLLAAFSALVLMAIAGSLTWTSRMQVVGVILAGGIATLLVGAAQLAGGAGSAFDFFAAGPYLAGFQGNHNSTADVLLIAMLAAAALGRTALGSLTRQPSAVQIALLATAVDGLFMLGVFFTGSRAGMVLIVPTLALQFLILASRSNLRIGTLAIAFAAVGTITAIGAVLLRGNRAIAPILARFEFAGEFRPELWRDTIFAIGQFWPAGSGMGTFVPVLIAVERLEVVDPTLPNRAHNDFLELALTGGLPGIIVLLAVVLLLGRGAFRSIRPRGPARSGGQAVLSLFSISVLAIIGLHSLVDYPLRSMALAGIAAVAAGMLFPARGAGSEPSGRTQ